MKLMQWKRVENSNDNITGLQLWLTLDGSNWYHYTNPLFSSYHKPEKHIDGIRASTGFSTFQYCLKQGFKVVDSESNLVN